MSDDPFDWKEIRSMTSTTDNLYNRVVPGLTFYDPDFDREPLPDYMDDEDWFIFTQRQDGKFEVMKGEAGESGYFAPEVADSEEDVYINFIDLYVQHLSWPSIVGIFFDLIEDVRNISSSLTKLATYQHTLSSAGVEMCRLVRTELEYLFMSCRSFYDLFQFIASNTWDMIEFEDGRGTVDLPTTFSSMALHDEKPREASELSDKYNLPDSLSDFYAAEAAFFSKLKEVRDSVSHEGSSFGTIFISEDGFAVDPESELLSTFDIWEPDQLNDNGIAPLWPFPAHIVEHSLSIMNKFISALAAEPVIVPPKLMPEYEYYLRGPHIRNLRHLPDLQDSDPEGIEFVEDVVDRLDLNSSE